MGGPAMSDIKKIVQHQPYKIACASCGKTSVITISLSKVDGDLVCECGARFPKEQLSARANEAEASIEKTVRDAGYR